MSISLLAPRGMAEPSPRQRRVRTPKTVHCAAVLREADGLLCLEDAENLLWSGGDLNAVDRMDLEQATRRKPRPETKPLAPTSLWRCPNCKKYGLFYQTVDGNECASCSWREPRELHLPAILSPRQLADARVEQKRLIDEVRARQYGAYVKMPKQHRVAVKEGIEKSACVLAIVTGGDVFDCRYHLYSFKCTPPVYRTPSAGAGAASCVSG